MDLVSIVIPVKEINNRLRYEVIPALKKQTYQKLEIVIVPDKFSKKEKFPLFVKIIPSWPKKGVAYKRDLGVKKSAGKIIAFIDDDVYPEKNWLRKAVSFFKNDKIAAVCGPGVTSPSDNLKSQVAGWVLSSWLGSAGAGVYRFQPGKEREVDDYPTFNLFVRKKDFNKVGGFNSCFWPGEDTKLCHDLVYKLGKKIFYHPKVLVYHHRREIFLPYLRQIARYGLHRGYFVKILPKTSRRINYFLPLIFVLGILSGLFLVVFSAALKIAVLSKMITIVYLFTIFAYVLVLFLTSLLVFLKSQNLKISILTIPTIFLTHFTYGIMFARGLLIKKLKEEKL